ncbi:NUDIX domain-containing protein [Pseudoruegeria sp. SHC-113]|uniref:NUDIX domain-containing protein n=1 Tax=Pseudoruegeria sp. SHC-113 TaxID=2855439 RepID=UPI0021BB3C22|nr:NUDIX domain-containing protein [Pseudoruegeria sp. SHC-113]MCT8160355.1 NUDIX domain-containing protein [Pseudoruegeria sp. SHC-113]
MVSSATGPGGNGADPAVRKLFFYGTLRHIPLLELVLGRKLPEAQLVATRLPEHRVYAVQDQIFPMIVQSPGGMAEGLLFSGATAADVERLEFYEGGFDFDLRPVTLENGEEALVFFPEASHWQPGAPWDLEAWIAAYGAVNLMAAEEFMSYLGRFSFEELTRRYPMMCNRAWSRMLAREKPPVSLGSGKGRADVEILSHTRPYSSFFALDEIRLRFNRFNGIKSGEIMREVFVGTDAIIVLPYDPVRDRVLVVEQIRMGPFVRGADVLWMLEPVAGLIDLGESPETAVRRETLEETGLNLGDLHLVSRAYPSPGATTEYYHTYIAIADLPDDAGGVAGLASEEEDIRSHVLSFDRLMEVVDSGEAQTGPLVMCALWLARNRERLRGDA